jgi:predicted dehydrogenase
MRIALVGNGYWGGKFRRLLETTKYELVIVTREGDVTKTGADAAIIATPPDSHHRLTLDALRSGMDVLVEKPMALCSEDAAEMVEVSIDEERVLSVDHTWLHTEAFAHLQTIKKPLLSYQAMRLGPPVPQAKVPASWDMISHDFAILDGLGKIGGRAYGTGYGDVAQASLDLVGKGTAFISVSRSWTVKERRVVLHYEDESYSWHDDRLFRLSGGTFQGIVTKETVEPLARVLADFIARCQMRNFKGLTDGESGVFVCQLLEQLYPLT